MTLRAKTQGQARTRQVRAVGAAASLLLVTLWGVAHLPEISSRTRGVSVSEHGLAARVEGSFAAAAVDTSTAAGLDPLHLPYLARHSDFEPEHAFVGMVGGPSWIVAPVSETLVWVGDGPHIVAMDATDPANMREVGRTAPLPGLPLGIAHDAAREVAVVAISPDTLLTLDVRDPRAPSVLGRLDVRPPADVRDVALGGDDSWAVVAAGPAGLLTIDLGDPAAPRLIAALDVGHPVGQVRAEGDRAVALPEIASRWPRTRWIAASSSLPAFVDVRDPQRPRILSRLTYTDTTGSTPPIGELVLDGDRAFALPIPEATSCVLAIDLGDPRAPDMRAEPCIPFLTRLTWDRGRNLLFAVDSNSVIRPLDTSEAAPRVLDPVGGRVSPTPFLLGPAAVHGDRLFMAADMRQETTGSFTFADRPRLDWRPWQAALFAFDIRGRGDLVAAGRRAHSMEAVHQLVPFDGRVLALVDMAPRQLDSRRMVLALDPHRPGQREILWPLTHSLRLHAQGERLFDLVRSAEGLQLREWTLGDEAQSVRRASVDLPPVPGAQDAPFDRWLIVGDEEALWVLGTAEDPRGTAPHTALWSVTHSPEGLRSTHPLTLALAVEDAVAWRDGLALAVPGSLRVISAPAARAGSIVEIARVDRPPGAVAQLGVMRDRLVLAERDVHAYALESDQLVEVTRYAFERVSPAHGWHTMAMAVRDDRVHLAGGLGLRSLRFDGRGFHLLAATADVPAVVSWRAREWPGPFEEVRYATIAALDDLIVADRRQLSRYDEPFQPAGFTIWRAP